VLALPDSPTDPIKLADWLELWALISRKGNSSRGDLERALRAAALAELSTDEAIEEIITSVFAELHDREKAAGMGYPYGINGDLLNTKSDWEHYPSYVFCLCLSHFGCKENKGSKSYPRRWFEHLSRDALQQYVGGCTVAVRFGSPRLKKELPTKFKDAVVHICKTLLMEGGDFKAGGLPDRKDDAVDIIAWKHFPDQLPGKLILFGNCATERDWEGSKRNELQPEAFCGDWMTDPPRCKIVKTLFIPHRIDRNRLMPSLGRAGIIFDRCRISYWTYFIGPTSRHVKDKRPFAYAPIVEWSRTTLKKRTR
jgi:hypothetical protein